ncbi:MAG: rRNA maturation RNase YbeY [Leeuwenhoekiella sp.]
MIPIISFSDQYDWDNFLSESEKIWLIDIAEEEGKEIAELDFVFCSDAYLLKINQDFLDHDTYTDIITFDYSSGNLIAGEIFISIERVAENAETFRVAFNNELYRVMAHGILHLCGYEDKTKALKNIMRAKEDFYLTKSSALK